MTHGAFDESDGMTAHYKDLREVYAKRMECHGNGMALMQPISGRDCAPVSAGFFDRNGDWNLITPLLAADPSSSEVASSPYIPLPHPPQRVSSIDIVWQPKTSLGVRSYNIDASGNTPDVLPAGVGADAHIKYSSSSKFGAILMTRRPVRLNAYNDEALFLQWLERNKERLYVGYGAELKRYGMWIVTRTYTAPACSINAWMDEGKDAVVSLKAKAAMLGELGEDLDWKESVANKDWSHYKADGPEGLVVFVDGIEVKPMEWWVQGLRQGLGGLSAPAKSPPRLTVSRSRSVGRRPEEHEKQQEQKQEARRQRDRLATSQSYSSSSSSSANKYAAQQDRYLAAPNASALSSTVGDPEPNAGYVPIRGRSFSTSHAYHRARFPSAKVPSDANESENSARRPTPRLYPRETYQATIAERSYSFLAGNDGDDDDDNDNNDNKNDNDYEYFENSNRNRDLLSPPDNAVLEDAGLASGLSRSPSARRLSGAAGSLLESAGWASELSRSTSARRASAGVNGKAGAARDGDRISNARRVSAGSAHREPVERRAPRRDGLATTRAGDDEDKDKADDEEEEEEGAWEGKAEAGGSLASPASRSRSLRRARRSIGGEEDRQGAGLRSGQ